MNKILMYALAFVELSVAIFFRYLFFFIKKDSVKHLPYTHGLFLNTVVAARRYTFKSFLYRKWFVLQKPELALEYFKILNNSERVVDMGIGYADIMSLKPQHQIITTHRHHRMRVVKARSYIVYNRINQILLTNEDFEKIFGSDDNIIVVDDRIMDGHHRISALIEAGYRGKISVKMFKTKKGYVDDFSNAV